jgi:hypothetical protein
MTTVYSWLNGEGGFGGELEFLNDDPELAEAVDDAVGAFIDNHEDKIDFLVVGAMTDPENGEQSPVIEIIPKLGISGKDAREWLYGYVDSAEFPQSARNADIVFSIASPNR